VELLRSVRDIERKYIRRRRSYRTGTFELEEDRIEMSIGNWQGAAGLRVDGMVCGGCGGSRKSVRRQD